MFPLYTVLFFGEERATMELSSKVFPTTEAANYWGRKNCYEGQFYKVVILTEEAHA